MKLLPQSDLGALNARADELLRSRTFREAWLGHPYWGPRLADDEPAMAGKALEEAASEANLNRVCADLPCTLYEDRERGYVVNCYMSPERTEGATLEDVLMGFDDNIGWFTDWLHEQAALRAAEDDEEDETS